MRSSTAKRDLIALCVVAAAALVVAVHFDAFEKFERWARAYEWWTYVHLVVVPLVLALAFGFYYWLRRRELEQSERRFRSMVQNASDVISIYEPDGKVRYVSPAVERMLGYEPGERLGRSTFDLVHPDDLERAKKTMAEGLRGPGARVSVEARVRHKDGSWRHVEATGTNMLHDPDVRGIVLNSRDVTERKRAEQALRESEAGLIIAQRIAHLGSWDTGPLEGRGFVPGQEIRWSDEMYRIFGFEPGSFTPTMRALVEAIHPGDFERVGETMRRSTLGRERSLELEHRILRPDGEARTVRVIIETEYDASGEPARRYGTMLDITESKGVEDALRRREAELAAAQRIAHVGNWVFEVERDEARWSDEMYRIFGFEPQEFRVSYKRFMRLVHPDDREKLRAAVREALYGDEGAYDLDYRLVRAEGEVRYLRARYETVRDAAGRPVRLIGTAHDITEQQRAEQALRESEARYRTLVEQTPAITYIEALDAQEAEHEILYVSPQIEELLGYSREEWTTDPGLFARTLHPDDRERVLAEDARTERTGEPFSVEYRNLTKDGRVVWLHDEAVLVRDDSGRPLYWQGVMYDVTEQKLAEEELRRSEVRNRAILEAIPDLIFRFDRDGECLDFQANDAAGLYVSREEIVGRNLRDTMPAELVEPALRRIAETLDTGEMQVFEYRLPMAEGARDYEARMVVYGPGEVLSVVRDVTERKKLEERLRHQAFHDDLTGLPNRALFAARLERALARADRQGGKVAVLFVDIDDFKSVNDSMGHWAGDELLAEFAKQLQASMRPGDTVARFGGDEFAVLLEGVTEEWAAAEVAKRVIEELRQEPYSIGRREILAAPSIGIAVSGYTELGWEDLLRRADVALHRAKEEGKARYACFTPDLDERLRRRLKLEDELRKALEREEFRVFYQPKVSIESGEIVGMEALVRWEHPERGLLAPSEFLAVAEETGLIVPIGEWVLRASCRQAKEWQERYPKDPPLAMSVNLSAKQFRQQDLADDIGAVLSESGLDPRGLTLEITEGTAMEDAPATTEALKKLKVRGIRIEVDDFGTGYSSLSYLKRFPVDYLKVDRSFVAGLGQNPEDEEIVRAVVALAHTLGLEVVAEGVETGEQLGLLREMGCELAQGFYFWGVLPAEAADELLAAYHA